MSVNSCPDPIGYIAWPNHAVSRQSAGVLSGIEGIPDLLNMLDIGAVQVDWGGRHGRVTQVPVTRVIPLRVRLYMAGRGGDQFARARGEDMKVTPTLPPIIPRGLLAEAALA